MGSDLLLLLGGLLGISLVVIAVLIWRLRSGHNSFNIELSSALAQKNAEAHQLELELETSRVQQRSIEKRLLDFDRMEMVADLSVSISREMNSPLGTSLTAATFILSMESDLSQRLEGAGIEPDLYRHLLEDIRQGTNQVVLALKQAISFSKHFRKLEIFQQDHPRGTILLHEFLMGQIDSIEAELAITASLVCEEIIYIATAPTALGAILRELFTNADTHARGIGNDGKRLQVLIQVSTLDDEVLVRVSDSGRGMTLDELENAFEAFYSTRKEEGQLGIGLYVVKHLVTYFLHGSISVDNATSESGACFTIRLPRV